MATYSSFGNIRKRTHSWGVSFFNPRDGEHDKEPHHIYRTFVRKSDAQAWLAAIQVSIQRGEWLSSREEKAAQERAARLAVINEKTFVQYADDWFAVKEHKPSTRTAYMKYYRNHLAPYWGETPLKEITTPLVAVWVKKHLAPRVSDCLCKWSSF